MKTPLLEVKNLSVVLDNEKIITNLSFSVSEGEIATILGPNGSGKSVLVKTLLGLLPYTGEIKWHKDFKVAYLPQGLNQLRLKNLPLTVNDFFNLKNLNLEKEEIVKFLNQVGLGEEILSKNAGSLSGGQFQRMLIAWVMISHPSVVFFDEPTTGIDIGGGETIYTLIHNIWKKDNMTIFLVTHDLNIIFKYSDNVLCLSDKVNSCFGSPKEILNPEMLEKSFGMEIKFHKHD